MRRCPHLFSLLSSPFSHRPSTTSTQLLFPGDSRCRSSLRPATVPRLITKSPHLRSVSLGFLYSLSRLTVDFGGRWSSGRGDSELQKQQWLRDRSLSNSYSTPPLRTQPSSAAVKHARNRYNCFNTNNNNDSSDDELNFLSDSLSANSSFSNPSDNLKVTSFPSPLSFFFPFLHQL